MIYSLTDNFDLSPVNVFDKFGNGVIVLHLKDGFGCFLLLQMGFSANS